MSNSCLCGIVEIALVLVCVGGGYRNRGDYKGGKCSRGGAGFDGEESKEKKVNNVD